MTLGLDVSMQLKLRDFIKEYNREGKTTIILTSHYMSDITALCERVILIHEGRILFDGDLSGLAVRMAPFKLVRLTFEPSSNIERSMNELSGMFFL